MSPAATLRPQTDTLAPFFKIGTTWKLLPLSKQVGSNPDDGMDPDALVQIFGNEAPDSYLNCSLQPSEVHTVLDRGHGIGINCGPRNIVLLFDMREFPTRIRNSGKERCKEYINDAFAKLEIDPSRCLTFMSPDTWRLFVPITCPEVNEIVKQLPDFQGVFIISSGHVNISHWNGEKAVPFHNRSNETSDLQVIHDLSLTAINHIDAELYRQGWRKKLRSLSPEQATQLLANLNPAELEKTHFATHDVDHLWALASAMQNCLEEDAWPLFNEWQLNIPRTTDRLIDQNAFGSFEEASSRFDIFTIIGLALHYGGKKAIPVCKKVLLANDLGAAFENMQSNPELLCKWSRIPDLEIDFLKKRGRTQNKHVANLNRHFAQLMNRDGQPQIIVKPNRGEEPFLIQERELHRHPIVIELEKSNEGKFTSRDWLAHEDRLVYDTMKFLPSIRPSESCFNSFTGFSSQKCSDAQCVAFLDMLRIEICNNDAVLFEYLEKFLAHLVQRPYEKPNVAIVLDGIDDQVKRLFFEFIEKMIGGRYVTHRSDLNSMLDRFNTELETSLVLSISEAALIGSAAEESRLSTLIAGNSLSIREPYRTPRTCKSYFRVFIEASGGWSPQASKTRYRYIHFPANERALDPGIKEAIVSELEHNGAAALLHHVSNVSIEGFDPGEVPATELQAKRKIDGLRNLDRFWYGVLTEGAMADQGFEEWSAGPILIPKSTFQSKYAHHAQSAIQSGDNRFRVMDRTEIGKALKRICPDVESRRLRRSGRQTQFYEFPSLSECRAVFERCIDARIDWDDIL